MLLTFFNPPLLWKYIWRDPTIKICYVRERKLMYFIQERESKKFLYYLCGRESTTSFSPPYTLDKNKNSINL